MGQRRCRRHRVSGCKGWRRSRCVCRSWGWCVRRGVRGRVRGRVSRSMRRGVRGRIRRGMRGRKGGRVRRGVSRGMRRSVRRRIRRGMRGRVGRCVCRGVGRGMRGGVGRGIRRRCRRRVRWRGGRCRGWSYGRGFCGGVGRRRGFRWSVRGGKRWRWGWWGTLALAVRTYHGACAALRIIRAIRVDTETRGTNGESRVAQAAIVNENNGAPGRQTETVRRSGRTNVSVRRRRSIAGSIIVRVQAETVCGDCSTGTSCPYVRAHTCLGHAGIRGIDRNQTHHGFRASAVGWITANLQAGWTRTKRESSSATWRERNRERCWTEHGRPQDLC